MSILAAIRLRKKLWIPRVAAVFSVMWVSMLLQPCAMAMGAGQMGMDHEQHSCPHCPPPMHEECVDEAVECRYLERFDVDHRASTAKFSAGSEDFQSVLNSYCEAPLLPARAVTRFSSPRHATAPPGPPLNVLFCVYLK